MSCCGSKAATSISLLVVPPKGDADRRLAGGKDQVILGPCMRACRHAHVCLSQLQHQMQAVYAQGKQYTHSYTQLLTAPALSQSTQHQHSRPCISNVRQPRCTTNSCAQLWKEGDSGCGTGERTYQRGPPGLARACWGQMWRPHYAWSSTHSRR